jgi:hypothetical protein
VPAHGGGGRALTVRAGVVRFCFGATFAIATFSLGLQFVQDWLGVWDDPGTVEPSHAVRIWRFFSYFTTQANLLVIATSLSLTVRADRDGSGWRVARLDALAGITITGLVHWFLLHPLDDFHGWLWASDTLVHHHRPGASGAGLAGVRASAADQLAGCLGGVDLASYLADLHLRRGPDHWLVSVLLP